MSVKFSSFNHFFLWNPGKFKSSITKRYVWSKYARSKVWFMVFNAIFNNISAISMWTVLLVEGIRHLAGRVAHCSLICCLSGLCPAAFMTNPPLVMAYGPLVRFIWRKHIISWRDAWFLLVLTCFFQFTAK